MCILYMLMHTRSWTLIIYFDIDFDLGVANHSAVLFKHAILHFPIYFIFSKPSF